MSRPDTRWKCQAQAWLAVVIVVVVVLFLTACNPGAYYTKGHLLNAGDNGYDKGYAACVAEKESVDILKHYEIYKFDKDKARTE
jgi:hypothetical protein